MSRRTNMATMRTPNIVLAASAIALFVASIIGFARDDTNGDEPADAGGTGAGAVTIIDFAFEPAELTVAVGDRVTWANQDSATHTVTSEEDGPLDSGDIGGDANYEATFDQPGTYDYICTIHPFMQGTVEVTNS